MNTPFPFSFLLLVLFSSFIQGKEPAPSTKSAPPLPLVNHLAQGVFWDYQVQLISPTPLNDPIVGKPIQENGKFLYFFDERRTYQGKHSIPGLKQEIDLLSIHLNNQKDTFEEQFLSIQHNGLWSFGMRSSNKVQGKPTQILLQNPIPLILNQTKPGMRWIWKDNDLLFEFRIITTESIIVPAGEYQALKVQMDQSSKGIPQKRRIYWFSTQIGIVKEEEDLYLKKGVILKKKWELLRTSLNTSE